MEKLTQWSLVLLGSSIGSWFPTLWGSDIFSLASIVGGLIGTALGYFAMTLVKDYIAG